MDEQQNSNMGQVEPSGSSSGPIIGVVIILVVIILAGLYFWGERSGTDTNTDQTVESITTQDASDDTDSIENDLNNTDIESIDAEINAS